MRTALLLLPILIVAAAPAAAQPSVEAEQLFRDGRSLMERRRYAEACAAFEGSQRLGPSLATLMNLADCREKNRQLASAWSVFLQVGSEARADARNAALGEVARKRAAALEPRLSRLVINVPDLARVDGLRVTRNGVEVDPAVWNRSIPVDGGSYQIAARAPGVAPWSITVEVGAEGDTRSVDVPRFEALPVATGPAPALASPVPDEPAPHPRRRALALTLGGLGVAAGAAALGFELSGRSTLDEANRGATQAERDDRYEQANRKHHVAQGLAVVAAAGVVGGVITWITGRPERAPARTALRPVLAPGQAGLALGGSF